MRSPPSRLKLAPNFGGGGGEKVWCHLYWDSIFLFVMIVWPTKTVAHLAMSQLPKVEKNVLIINLLKLSLKESNFAQWYIAYLSRVSVVRVRL